MNKKGVSVMIGYVLLVVIAIGLSIAVFTYLRLYLPSEEPQCPDDVILTIEEATCTSGQIDLTLRNRGLFSTDGAFIRVGEVGRVYRQVLNEDNAVRLFFTETGNKLEPGSEWSPTTPYSPLEPVSGALELEIEPVVIIEEKIALCEKAVITKIIDCG